MTIRLAGILGTTALFLAACATAPTSSPVPHCSGAGLHVDARFEGGNLHRCEIGADGGVRIALVPENEPINPSPWYAFRISSGGHNDVTGQATTVNVRIDHGSYRARYWPKVSRDGKRWEPLPAERVTMDGSSLAFQLPLTATPLWISGQELLASDWYADWLRDLDRNPALGIRLIGASVEGRPLHAALSAPREKLVVLIGRQHPPEVTGALAMRPFVDAVTAETALARHFRAHYQLVIVPFLNPDGVAHGHWRHNVNGVDLNRDWGTFSQPETHSVASLLAEFETTGARPALMLDFHSTRESLFYTQMPGDLPGTPDFATAWLESARARLPDYAFSHEPRPPSSQENTKNYFFSHYGIPAITYELGDHASRAQIAASSVVFAEEMMRLLLAEQTAP